MAEAQTGDTGSLVRRYRSLQALLAANNDALELISELENDLLLLPVSDPQVRARVERLFGRSTALVAALRDLTDGRYGELETVLETVRREADGLLAAARQGETGPLAYSLAEAARTDGRGLGAKAHRIAQLRCAGLPVPDGFILSSAAYQLLVRSAGLGDRLRHGLHVLDVEDPDALARVSDDLRACVNAAPTPPEIVEAVAVRLRALMCRASGTFAVRSSAVGEDGARTFAGQFDSCINVPSDRLVEAYREVCASRFNARAIAYRRSAGVAEIDCPMAALVLRMVDARTSGVLYTRDPTDARADTILVTSSWGVGFTGSSPGDRFLVRRRGRHTVFTRHIALKGARTVLLPEGGTRVEALRSEVAAAPSLSDDELAALADVALEIEHTSGSAQDIEWAIDRSGAVWILQARPLRLQTDRTRAARAPKTAPLVSGGITVYPGQVSGPIHVADSAKDLSRVPEGAIVVLKHTCPECVKFLPRIGGLVVDHGNPAGHAAALVREFRVPALFETLEATDRLASLPAASLDAASRRVYPGRLFASAEDAGERARRRSLGPANPLCECITALKLLDPKAWSFRPASCRSVHDVVRFVHERAIQSVFALGDDAVDQPRSGIKLLESDVPVDFYVLDLGGGLDPEARDARRVRPEAIRSVPFRALWRGMSHPEVSWAGREYVSLSGFASVVARAITDRATEPRALGARSYVAIAEDYLNLNSRLAYHYAMVDASVSDAQGANFANFRFKGGGADPYRKNLRARFLEECLHPHGWAVDVRQDLVTAWIKNYPRAAMEERLDLLGRLMGCARQLDMFMASEDTMRWYVQQFLEGNYRFRAPGAEGSH